MSSYPSRESDNPLEGHLGRAASQDVGNVGKSACFRVWKMVWSQGARNQRVTGPAECGSVGPHGLIGGRWYATVEGWMAAEAR